MGSVFFGGGAGAGSLRPVWREDLLRFEPRQIFKKEAPRAFPLPTHRLNTAHHFLASRICHIEDNHNNHLKRDALYFLLYHDRQLPRIPSWFRLVGSYSLCPLQCVYRSCFYPVLSAKI